MDKSKREETPDVYGLIFSLTENKMESKIAAALYGSRPDTSYEELIEAGVSDENAVKIIAAIELGRRVDTLKV